MSSARMMSPRPVGKRVQKVLIIDDDAAMRSLIRQTLIPLGVTCLEADDGMAAMNILEERCPDIIILDYQLPAWDGLELLRHIRTMPHLGTSRTIFMTGQASDDLLEMLMTHYLVDAVLAKPFRIVDLYRLVVEFLDQSKGIYPAKPVVHYKTLAEPAY